VKVKARRSSLRQGNYYTKMSCSVAEEENVLVYRNSNEISVGYFMECELGESKRKTDWF